MNDHVSRLLANGLAVFERDHLPYRSDCVCRFCGAEWGTQSHDNDCAWENARMALLILSRPAALTADK